MFSEIWEHHLHLIDHLVAATAAGAGRVLLLDGPIASGKTELLRRACDRAAAAGWHTAEASCSRAERTLRLGALGQLIRSAPLPPGTAAALTARIDAVRGPGSGEVAVVDALDATCSALLDLADRRPLLVAVDDVRDADLLSARFLLHLVRRLRAAPVLVVLTEDGTAPGGDDLLPTRLARHPDTTRTRLTPLSKDDVVTVLHNRLGHSESDRLAPEFHAASGGNPLLLRSLLEDHAVHGEDEAPSYGPALLSCLHCTDPVMLRVVRALAVLDTAADAETVPALLRADRTEVERAVTAMNAAGLIDDHHFRHPAGRAAVLDDLPAPELTELHRRAAGLLHDREAEVGSVAAHLVTAGRAEADWEIGVLRAAAAEAVVGDEYETAVGALALAHTGCADDRERDTIEARLAQAEWHLNPAAPIRRLARLVAAAKAGRLDRHDSLVLVRQLLWHGRTGEAAEVLDRVRGEAHAAQDDELRATELWLATSHPSLARRRTGPTGGDTRVPDADPALLATARMAEALGRGTGADAVEQASAVLDTVRVNHGAQWADESAVFALLVLISANRADLAGRWCDRLVTEADNPTWRAVFTGARALTAARQGDLPSAARHARSALALLPAKGWGVAIGFPLGSLILATSRSGRYRDSAKLLTRPVPEAMFETRYALPYLYARADYHLRTNHFHAALSDFLACGRLLRRWGLESAGLVPWQAGAAETWLRLGEPDQARRLVYDELAHPGVSASPGRGSALRVLAAISPVDRRLRLLTEALGHVETTGDRFEQARVLTDIGRTQHTLGDHRRSRTALRRAWHIAKTCEAAPVVHELLSIPGTHETVSAPEGPDRPGMTTLTDSERRVAALAVLGYTNREIAAKLTITASTVEQHLTRVYRKLDVKSRDDLPVELRIPFDTSA